MRRGRFAEAQIIEWIKEQGAGLPTSKICRKHGLSSGTFFILKGKYVGMGPSDTERLKWLSDDNWKLKRLLADAMLDNLTCPPIVPRS